MPAISSPSSPNTGRPIALIALAVVLLIAFFALGSALGSTGSWVLAVVMVLILAAAARWTWSGVAR